MTVIGKKERDRKQFVFKHKKTTVVAKLVESFV